MKNVIFYTGATWAFGALHWDLCRQLYPFGYNCRILDTGKIHYRETAQAYDPLVDCWVTTGDGLEILVNQFYIHPRKIWMVCHAPHDWEFTLRREESAPLVKECAGYAATTVELQKSGRDEYGCPRQIQLTPVGVDSAHFQMPISERLRTIGFAGKRQYSREQCESQMANSNMIAAFNKRHWLVDEVAEAVGLTVKAAYENFHNATCLMPGFYQSVDAIMVASTHEGASMPLMEGGASGRLLLSSGLGLWSEQYGSACVDFLPTPAEEYKEAAIERLIHYRDHPEAYRQRCLQIRENCRKNDWKYHAPKWAQFLSQSHP